MSAHSRRIFIQNVAFLGGGAVLLGGACQKSAERAKAQGPVAETPAALQTFTPEEYRAMSEAVDRILPRDEDVGAIDAGVPIYVDRMLASTDLRPFKRALIGGLNALDRRAQRAHGMLFADLPDADQDALLADFKDGKPGSGEARFYEALVFLTLEGFLGDPSYGGNRDRAGWALVGFGTTAPGHGYHGEQHLHGLKHKTGH